MEDKTHKSDLFAAFVIVAEEGFVGNVFMWPVCLICHRTVMSCGIII